MFRVKLLTCFGLSCVTLSPWPRRPYSPQPHVYSSPDDVMAALCDIIGLLDTPTLI